MDWWKQRMSEKVRESQRVAGSEKATDLLFRCKSQFPAVAKRNVLLLLGNVVRCCTTIIYPYILLYRIYVCVENRER